MVLLAEGADRAMWRHTSCVLAMMYMANRDSKTMPPRSPQDFDPYAQLGGERSREKSLEVPITALKALFVKEPPSG